MVLDILKSPYFSAAEKIVSMVFVMQTPCHRDPSCSRNIVLSSTVYKFKGDFHIYHGEVYSWHFKVILSFIGMHAHNNNHAHKGGGGGVAGVLKYYTLPCFKIYIDKKKFNTRRAPPLIMDSDFDFFGCFLRCRFTPSHCKKPMLVTCKKFGKLSTTCMCLNSPNTRDHSYNQ